MDKDFSCLREVDDSLREPACIRKIKDHPCFSENARHRFGRMHLPVAPKCNIQCNYCIIKYDCVNESRPGVTSEVITPEEALIKVKDVIDKFPFIRVIAVAGPGEPLFNEETFSTFRLVKEEFPSLKLCISTNGLLLPLKVNLLKDLGVETITVTLNAIGPEISEKIYSYIIYNGKRISGKEGAKILLDNQLEGIETAIKLGLVVKINTVMIPEINSHHILDIAKKIKELGVYTMNIMPLISQYKFSHIPPPTIDDRKKVQDECTKFIKQMRHCRQCRSDAVGLLGKDINLDNPGKN